MSRKTFEGSVPELAGLCSQRLNGQISYLATIKQNGSPRLHPITPFIGNGMLFMFTEPSSPKIRDLQQDSRYAIHHSSIGDRPLVEVQVCGKAKAIVDPGTRQLSEHVANSSVVTASYALFEFQVSNFLVVEYDQEQKPIVCRWKSESLRNLETDTTLYKHRIALKRNLSF
jgi:hypothetical protein